MNLSRQSDILPKHAIENIEIVIVGAGATGSYLGPEVGKMGCEKITVHDADIVAPENPSSQNFRMSDVGRLKVDAFKEIVEMFSTAKVTAIPKNCTGDEKFKGIVIMCVDTMQARIDIWNKGIKFNPLVSLYLDPRSGAEELRLYAVDPNDPDEVARYEESLYPDSQAYHAPCTAKSIAYTPIALAAVIGRELKAYLTGEPVQFVSFIGLKSRGWVVQ